MYFEAYSKRLEIKAVCRIAKIERSALYYFNSHKQIKNEKDLVFLNLIKSLDEEDKKIGSKVKAHVLLQKEGKSFI